MTDKNGVELRVGDRVLFIAGKAPARYATMLEVIDKRGFRLGKVSVFSICNPDSVITTLAWPDEIELPVAAVVARCYKETR